MKLDALGDRMKGYENISRHYLIKRMPVIIRLDMRAGHTFTRGLKKPFDKVFMTSMQETMQLLCQNISGCVFGYTQSDEISLLLIDYQTFETSAWFDNGLNKLVSISASMATLYFNKRFHENSKLYLFGISSGDTLEQERNYLETLEIAEEKGATFDSRAFNLPKEEVTNYFLWRQNDAVRNSILNVGQHYFSQKELFKKSCNDIKDMLRNKGAAWEDLETFKKVGTACVKVQYNEEKRPHFELDYNMPILLDTGREYVEQHLRLC